jgi:hypothetical protein
MARLTVDVDPVNFFDFCEGFVMRIVPAVLCLGLVAASALAAGYDHTDKSDLLTARLRVPEAAMAIMPLKDLILKQFQKDAASAKSAAADEKKDNSAFRAFEIDAQWRVTFENAAVISLSANIYKNFGGAHPNQEYATIVWDKAANRVVPLEGLFAKGQSGAALHAIADAATKSWVSIHAKRSSEAASKETRQMAAEGIQPDAAHLAHYALTYAKGENHANGIVLLYGAGEVWSHAEGDYRLSAPVSVFAQYLTPQWKQVFAVQ